MPIRFRSIAAASALSVCVAAALGSMPIPVHAQQSRAAYQFDLPAQPLADTLRAIARQTGANVLFESKDVNGVRAIPLRGQFTPQQAIERVLDGTGLSAEQTTPTTAVIRSATVSTPTNEAVQGLDGSGDSARSVSEDVTAPRAASTPRTVLGITDVQGMTVTGTRIRGGTTPSPVITIGAENIRDEGFADLGEVIRSVPQNFSGGQNPGVLMGNVTGGGLANQNMTGGSGLNLRGLGPDATLTLLNGRRMSYGGIVQAVDVSAIPVEAVDRIEIVADGASAIYGSDAVGGVANVILAPGFEGFALGARYGAATDGGLSTWEYTGTAGKTWESGGIIAAYKRVSTDPIDARQRDYTDHIPEPATIYPGSELRSGLLSASQSVGDLVELRLDALRTKREQLYYYYFSSPTIYNKLIPETTSTFVAPSARFTLPNDWTLSLDAAWGEDELRDFHQRPSASTGLLTLLRHVCFCNKIRTYEIGAEGPLFEMSGGDVRFAVGAGYRKNEFFQANLVTGINSIEGDESSRFAYAELSLPLIGPPRVS